MSFILQPPLALSLILLSVTYETVGVSQMATRTCLPQTLLEVYVIEENRNTN